MSDTFVDKIAREKELVASLPGQIPSGITDAVNDAWENKGRTAFEVASAVGLGTVFTLLSRNPNAIVEQGVKMAGYAFTGLAAFDLADRFYEPMHDTWNNPAKLTFDKKWLGGNVGDALFNYGVAIGAGGSGAYFGERAIETTKFGELLSGQKVTHFDTSAAASKLDSSGDRLITPFQSLLNLAQPERPFSSYSLREFADGTKLITSNDGLAILTPKSGPDLWFKSKQDWWSLNPTVEALPRSPFQKTIMDSFDTSGGSMVHSQNTWKFNSQAPEANSIDVGKFTNKFFSFERGGEGGIGAVASQWAFERAGDIGSAMVQHKLLVDHEKHRAAEETNK